MNIDQENTVRALKDATPIVNSKWCFWGFHTWEQWSKPYQPNKNSSRMIQHAYCVCCNVVKTKKVPV